MVMKIFKEYDSPPIILSAICKLPENSRAKVITPNEDREYFEVLQGDALA